MLWDIIVWIVVGFVAGALAKFLVKGDAREPKGFVMTTLLGIAGALIVGFVMNAFGLAGTGYFIMRIVGATIGACLLILAFRKFWREPAR